MIPLAVRGRGVRAVYGGRVALHDADFEMPSGAVTALVGPNGSGKSTLLSVVAGLLPLAGGQLSVLGRRPGDPAVSRRVAYVLQSTAASRALPVTVREVVTMARFAGHGMFGRLRAADRRAVDDALERLEVADLADRHLLELSVGQRQRALVAQGLAQDADLLLLDEPVTGLDLTSRERIMSVIEETRARGIAVAVATHDLNDAERADHVLLLAGAVVASGRPDEVITTENLRRAYGGHLAEPDATVSPPHLDEHVHVDEVQARRW